MCQKHIIWTDNNTTIYEYKGLTLSEENIKKRWKYFGHHIASDKENLKVIFVDSTCSTPTNRRPFNYCTKTEWNSNEIHTKFPNGMHIQDWDKRSPSVPLGAFTQSQKTVFKRTTYRSVSDPLMGEKVSEKIICFFERRVKDDDSNRVTDEAAYLMAKLERNTNANHALQGISAYKNVSHFVSDAPFIEIILEITILPDTSMHFKPLLDMFFDKLPDDVGFCFGLYKRHKLLDRDRSDFNDEASQSIQRTFSYPLKKKLISIFHFPHKSLRHRHHKNIDEDNETVFEK